MIKINPRIYFISYLYREELPKPSSKHVNSVRVRVFVGIKINSIRRPSYSFDADLWSNIDPQLIDSNLNKR